MFIIGKKCLMKIEEILFINIKNNEIKFNQKYTYYKI